MFRFGWLVSMIAKKESPHLKSRNPKRTRRSPNDTLTSTNVYLGGKLISKGTYNSSGTGDCVNLTPVAADRLGSIGKFYPYGTERPSATANDKEKFTGYFRDSATGLDYADQRYEQPGGGRFMTPDPYGGSANVTDPGSWNRYAYVGGDPVNRTDPSGELFLPCGADEYASACDGMDGGGGYNIPDQTTFGYHGACGSCEGQADYLAQIAGPPIASITVTSDAPKRGFWGSVGNFFVRASAPEVELMLLGGGYPVAILGGYLDDSSDDKREQHFSFGGIICDVEQMGLFTLRWLSATHNLKEPFRSTDCETGHGQFETWGKPARDKLTIELVKIIREMKAWGYASAVSVIDYKSVFPNSERFDPFFLCVKSAIAGMANLADHIDRRIDMWFEEGDHDSKIQEIHKALKNLPQWPGRSRLMAMTPRDKSLVPLQGADLYAREAFKHFNNLGRRAERKPVTALKKQLMFHCWTLPALEELKRQGGPDNLSAIANMNVGGQKLVG